MRSIPRPSLAFLVSSWLLGCSQADGPALDAAHGRLPDATRAGESAPSAASSAVASAPAPPRPASTHAVVACTDRGLALVMDGRIVAETVTGAIVQDLVAGGDRVVTFETSDEGEGGLVVARTLSSDGFGPPEVQRFVDGRARLAWTPAGIVVFESSYGDRWRVLASHVGSSLVAPMPSSAWWDGTHLTALSRDADQRFALRTVTVSASSITEERRVELAALVDDTARATPRHVIDVVHGEIVVRSSSSGALSPPGLESDGLGDAVDLSTGVAITTTGPARLLVHDASRWQEFPLDEVYADAELLAHTLVPFADDHLAVATPSSLYLLRLGAKVEPVVALTGVHAPIARFGAE